MEDIPEEKHSSKEEDHDEDDEEEEDNENDEEESEEHEEHEEHEEKKTGSKNSKNSKKFVEVSQKNSNISKDKKLSLNSSKIALDASSKKSNLPVYSDIMKENSDQKPPSLHYSDKYKNSQASSQISKLSKLSQKSQNSGLPTFNKIISSDNNQDVNPPSIHFSDKYSKESKKSSSKISELPTFNDVMNSEPNKELKTPSIHYSSKYGKNLKKIDTKNLLTFNEVLTDQNQELNTPSLHYSEKYGKKSLNSIKTKSKKSDNSKSSKLPTFNQVTTDQKEEQNPPSIHFSDKYEKNSTNSLKSIKDIDKDKDKEKQSSNLITFNDYMNTKDERGSKPPSVHYSEKYGKNSINSLKSIQSKGKLSSKLMTFNEYMNAKEERESKPPSVHYSEKYGKNIKIEERKIPEKDKKSDKKSEKASEGLPTFDDYINRDPESNLNFQNINFTKRYNKEEDLNLEIRSSMSKRSNTSRKSKRSLVSKKSVRFKMGNVESERVIVLDDKEKGNLPKLLCANCNKFPLEPMNCSDCNCILCGECMKNKTKCLKCSSIFKYKKLDEDLKNLFSLCKIICKYSPCGCQEQLSPNEILHHEKTCKDNKKKCENCGEVMTYEKYLKHHKECGLNLTECETCGYKDSVREYDKTNRKIEHIKHILFPEIENIVKKEVEKAVSAINDSLDKRDAYKEAPDNKLEDELKKRLLDIQQLLLNMQPKNYADRSDDLGKMTKAQYLDRKIKNVKLVLTVPSKIDNAFECNDKYCIVHTFKNDNFILYPNIKYGINCYNLSSSKDIVILPKAFESNITCMASCQNTKKNLSYFAAASYDRTIKVYTIEDGFKKIKTYKEIFQDYSNFMIDLYCYNNQIILLAGNENLKQIKVLYPEEGEKEKTLMKTMTCKNKILFLKHNPSNEEEFFMGNDEGIFLYNIFNLIGEGDDSNKNIDIEKEYIDKSDEKSKHICITFLENEKNIFVEGDSLGVVRVWKIKEGELQIKIKRGILKFQISSLDAWSGRTIIGGTKDGKLIIYDIYDGVAVGEIGEHKGYVYCVKIAENWKYEKIVTSCGFDGQLKIWATLDS